ncbi:hypothetical protein KCTC52924_02225 [Arenibacter antarcticus]|uniref:DUF6702 family protein n=1 Tax=Arenibacter antarcticus TaxID=2040469 RepID=A0ABW5VK24_9FLAO|nr:DUF6702 family protein [Arenibacter sp. H213]MCM4169626.1 hypothetical protein [Arenibacter sp. H213]
MGIIKKSCLLLLLPLFAFTAVHKFYLSVSKVEYSEKDRALQITTRIFIDDFDRVLQERYETKLQLGTKMESPQADMYIEKYLKSKFLISINGENASYKFLGKQYEDDIAICYLEVTEVAIESTRSIEVQNEVLMDLFEDQKNVIHFVVGGNKKSHVLIRENNKGMLNLE